MYESRFERVATVAATALAVLIAAGMIGILVGLFGLLSSI